MHDLDIYAAFVHHVAPTQDLCARRITPFERRYARASKDRLKGCHHAIVRVQGSPDGDGPRRWGSGNRIRIADVDLPVFWREFGEIVHFFATSVKSRWTDYPRTQTKPSLTIDLVPFVDWYPIIWGDAISDEMMKALEVVLRDARSCADGACLGITLRLSDRSRYAGDGSFTRTITNVAGELDVHIVYETYQQIFIH